MLARFLLLVVLILGVPIVGFLASQGLDAYTSADSHADVALLGQASVWAAAAGLAILAAIGAAGLVARSNRHVLLWVFEPGLYLTALALIGLMLTHAAVAMATIFVVEASLFHRVHGGVILVIGLGALAGVANVARYTFGVVRVARATVVGVRVGWKQAPHLWELVAGLAKRIGTAAPQHIVLGLDPNFFVTEAEVRCLDGTLTGRTLYCSLPLLRILTRPECCSVIGHELAHYKGQDTRFSQRFYPIYRGTSDSIAALQRAGGDDSAIVALLPAIAIFSYFLQAFAMAESQISRERELEADRAGASVASSSAMAAALVKVHAFTGVWSNISQAAAAEIRQGRAYVNPSKVFGEAVLSAAKPEALRNIQNTSVPHPTDSHPPLAARLASLKIPLGAVADAALNVAPPEPAIGLIAEPERVEEHVSEAYQSMLAHSIASAARSRA